MVLGRVKMDNIFLTCDQSNFDGITTQDWNQPLVTEVTDAVALCVSGILFFQGHKEKKSALF